MTCVCIYVLCFTSDWLWLYDWYFDWALWRRLTCVTSWQCLDFKISFAASGQWFKINFSIWIRAESNRWLSINRCTAEQCEREWEKKRNFQHVFMIALHNFRSARQTFGCTCFEKEFIFALYSIKECSRTDVCGDISFFHSLLSSWIDKRIECTNVNIQEASVPLKSRICIFSSNQVENPILNFDQQKGFQLLCAGTWLPWPIGTFTFCISLCVDMNRFVIVVLFLSLFRHTFQLFLVRYYEPIEKESGKEKELQWIKALCIISWPSIVNKIRMLPSTSGDNISMGSIFFFDTCLCHSLWIKQKTTE